MYDDRKKELQKLIAEAQENYSKHSAELKSIFAEAKAEKAKAKFGDYKFKVYWYDTPEGDITPVQDEDYAHATYSSYGLPILHYPETKTQETYLLMKSEDELPRLMQLIKRIQAVNKLVSRDPKANVRPVEEALGLHKIILGEE